MKLSPEERETIILFSDADDTASVYTHDKRLIKKLEALCRKCPAEVHIERNPAHGAHFYVVPKNCVSVREPVSQERREAASKRAKENGIMPPMRGVTPQLE